MNENDTTKLERDLLDAILPVLDAHAQIVKRCPSCEHYASFHTEAGCWFTVLTTEVDANAVCPCNRPKDGTVKARGPITPQRILAELDKILHGAPALLTPDQQRHNQRGDYIPPCER